MRYFLHLAYNGYNYRGWQRQTSSIGVQQLLEDTLSIIFKQKITCLGCGRTDAMVHSVQYFVHFDLDTAFDFDLVFRLAKSLPHDIVVFEVIPMEIGNEHARFDAIERSYSYFIHTDKDPYLHTLSSYYEYTNLDLAKMKQAADLLKNYTDFRAFCLSPDRHNSTICHITDVRLYTNKQKNRLRFEISANRFLKGMIRIIIAKLLEVGNDKLSIADFEAFLTTQERAVILKPAYPQGLYLSKVRYPFLDIPTRTEFWNIFNGIEWIEIKL